ncbi:MAG: hypothetical protein KAS94_00275, partial [Desulfobulbaceae bacterium]|nr:hypothetical protein [Desulfobulbaceae bacterium]
MGGRFRHLSLRHLRLLCLVLILLLTSGCDNIPALLMKSAVDIKIPSGPEGVTQEHFDRLHYSWMYRNTVEAYRKSSPAPNDYDQAAVAFLDRISQIESHIDTNPDWQEVMQKGSTLLRAGCRHPLVNLWYGVAMFKNNRVDGAESALKNLRNSLPDPGFPASQGFFQARTLLEIIHYRLGNLDRAVPGKFELLISSLADGLRNKEFFDMEARVCYRLVNNFSRDLDYPD